MTRSPRSRNAPLIRGKGRRPPHRGQRSKPATSATASHRQNEHPFTPRVNPHLKPILQTIGLPEQTPFVPDPFQIEALERLAKGDVIVSAPTGSGKTYIAVEAMAGLLAQGKRAWYASPLKALSNSKYLEFGRRFGQDNVGLLTGDHKVNADAPLVVGTTEILRNQLYDAMHHGQDLPADLVVMDEAHYLGDPDRGVVWEEVIIYLAPRTRLLLLSATVANAEEIAAWLRFIRGRPAATVISGERPVPLEPLFLFPDGELAPLSRDGHLFPKIRHFLTHAESRHAARGGRLPHFGRILRALAVTNLLPAIFFLKSRADCDTALRFCLRSHEAWPAERRHLLEARLEELLDQYPFLRTHPQRKYLIAAGVAAHHAGQLPHWKLVIERLMQDGLLAAIFSTSTVAAGVNFPARTVVLTQSDRFDGRVFVDLRATDLHQMTGRAGRRGMDRIGFAVVVPGPFLDTTLIHALFEAESEPVESQIQINFSMVLNLLLSHRPEDVRHLLGLSLAAFQQQGETGFAEEVRRLHRRLEELIGGGACRDPDQALFLVQRASRLEEEIRRLGRARPTMLKNQVLDRLLVPGRVFERQDGRRYVVLEPRQRRGRPGLLAAPLRPNGLLKKGRLRTRWVPREAIGTLMDERAPLAPNTAPDQAADMIRSLARQKLHALDIAQFEQEAAAEAMADLDGRMADLHETLERLPCNTCPLRNDCVEDRKGTIRRLLERLEALYDEAEQSSQRLWADFLRHLDFLREENFVNARDELTEDGEWAAQLRLDHPMIVAAAIRARAWPEEDPVLLAALIAPFVVDKERADEPDGVRRKVPPTLAPAWFKLEEVVNPLVERLDERGFSTPSLSLKPALAVHLWASGGEWEAAVAALGLDEGDMAMLAFRTADNLRQIAALTETHPALARAARKAMDLVLREPVTVPL